MILGIGGADLQALIAIALEAGVSIILATRIANTAITFFVRSALAAIVLIRREGRRCPCEHARHA